MNAVPFLLGVRAEPPDRVVWALWQIGQKYSSEEFLLFCEISFKELSRATWPQKNTTMFTSAFPPATQGREGGERTVKESDVGGGLLTLSKNKARRGAAGCVVSQHDSLALLLVPSLHQVNAVSGENLPASFSQQGLEWKEIVKIRKKREKKKTRLEVVILKNFDEGHLELGDLETLWNSLDQLDGVDVRAHVLQEASDVIWFVQGVLNEILPKLLVILLLGKLDSLKSDIDPER